MKLKPFKGAKPKQNRGRRKPKEKPLVQRQNPPKDQDTEDQYAYDGYYYHNDTYSANGQSRGRRPFNGQSSGRQFLELKSKK